MSKMIVKHWNHFFRLLMEIGTHLRSQIVTSSGHSPKSLNFTTIILTLKS